MEGIGRANHVRNSCKVPNCKNVQLRSGRNAVRFFRFPKEIRRQEAWKQFCNISNNINVSNFQICAAHFRDDDYYNDQHIRLLPFAIPTIKVADPCEIAPATCQGTLGHNTEGDDACPVPDLGAIDVGDHDNMELEVTEAIEVPAGTSQSVFPSVEEVPSPSNEDSLVSTTASSEDPNDFAFLSKPVGSKPSRHNFLRELGLTAKELSPRKLKMYELHKVTVQRLSKLKSKLNTERETLSKLKKLYESNAFEAIESGLNSMTKEFIKSQLRNCDKRPGGKRYTDKMKLFALTLYKRSPRLYKYLRLHFELPSPRLLKKLLNNVPFETGFHNNMLRHLQSRVDKMKELDRYCSLIFDEIKLDSSFYYDSKRQEIVGFEDLGHLGRSEKNANHALVFMIRGLRRRWKQPISYYFTASTISTASLKQLIVEAIKQLDGIGLRVVTTVCDQAPTNVAATSQLCKEMCGGDTPSMTHFIVNGRNINIMYDLGHLLKNTRNALLRCAIQFDNNKFAKFEHIEQLFKLDQAKMFKALPKLNPEHFNFKNSYMKMKVSVAARQLSNSIASGLETYSSFGVLPAEALHTAEFVHILDQLFDSLNGSTRYASAGKPLLCAVRPDSPHLEFWTELLPKMKNWKLIDLETKKDVTSQYSFLNGWLVTIRSTMSTWRYLRNAGFEYLCTRTMNQDPLENLFSNIRQHGIANTNPTCQQFKAALKTCIVNNLASSHNVAGNCEDDGDSVLADLSDFLKPTVDEHIPGTVLEESGTDTSLLMDIDEEVPSTSEKDGECKSNLSEIVDMEESQALAYVSGYILRRMSVPECQQCHSDLFTEELTQHHTFVTFKEIDDQRQRLTYSSVKFMEIVQNTHELLYEFLNRCGHHNNLESEFTGVFNSTISSQVFSCSTHRTELCVDFLKKSLSFLIYKYVNDLNRGTKQSLRKAAVRHSKKLKTFKA